MYLKKENETSQNQFEICDKEYNLMLLKNKSLSKYPILEQYILSLKTKNDNIKCFPTNINELDKVLGGGLSSGLYIIGANPGLGKTSLILHLLINLALNQQHSLFFNLEMSPFQVITKLLSNFSNRNCLEDNSLNKMTINELSSKSLCVGEKGGFSDNYKTIIKKYSELIDPFINIISRSEDSSLTEINNCNYVECVETAINNYMKYHGITPVIVIDFLQLLQLRPVYNEDKTIKQLDKRLEVNEIMDKLKKYSSVYKTPIILISSLSRNAYTKEISDDDETEYSLSIFKETGHIEYTADFLALLTKGQTKTSFSEEDQTVININVLKTRYSQHTGAKIPLGFIPEYSYFKEIN